MSPQYMILGILMENPAHGYDLKTRFFKHIFKDFGINDGQLYPTLNRMEKDGFIKKEVEIQQGTPNRHVYTITPAGRKHFMEWLESSEGEDRSFRYDFVRNDAFFNRCNFIRHLGKDKALAKMAEQKKLVQDTLSDFFKARDEMIEREVDPFRVKVLEFGIRNQQARLEWIEDFIEEIEKDKTPPKKGCKRTTRGTKK